LKTSRGGQKSHGGEQLSKKREGELKEIQSKEWDKDWKEKDTDINLGKESKDIPSDILGEDLRKETSDTADEGKSEDKQGAGFIEKVVEGAKTIGTSLKSIGNAIIGNTEMKDTSADKTKEDDRSLLKEGKEELQDPKEVIIENDKIQRGEGIKTSEWTEPDKVPVLENKDEPKPTEGLKEEVKPTEDARKNLKSSEKVDEGAHIEGFQQLEGVKFLRPGAEAQPEPAVPKAKGYWRRRGKGKNAKKQTKPELKSVEIPKQTPETEQSVSSQTLEKPVVPDGELAEVLKGMEPKGKRKFHRFRRGKKPIVQEKEIPKEIPEDTRPTARLGSFYVRGQAPKDSEIKEEPHLEGFEVLEGVEFLRPGTEIGTARDSSRKFGKELEGQEFQEPLKHITESKDFKKGEAWIKGKEMDAADKATLEDAARKGVTPGENRADLQGMRDKETKDAIMEKLEGDRELDPTEADDNSEDSIESAIVPENLPHGDVSKVMFPTTHVPAQGARPIKGVIIPEEATDKSKLEDLNLMLESEFERKSKDPYVGVPSQVIINQTTKVDEAREAIRDLEEEKALKDTPSS
jgi:hypothetical protein